MCAGISTRRARGSYSPSPSHGLWGWRRSSRTDGRNAARSWPRVCTLAARGRLPRTAPSPVGESMSLTIGQVAGLQLQQVAVDTPVVKMMAAERTWFDTVTGIASGIMTLTLLALTIALAPAAWNFRKSHKKFSELLDRV